MKVSDAIPGANESESGTFSSNLAGSMGGGGAPPPPLPVAMEEEAEAGGGAEEEEGVGAAVDTLEAPFAGGAEVVVAVVVAGSIA
jgi:hypothetical protein